MSRFDRAQDMISYHRSMVLSSVHYHIARNWPKYIMQKVVSSLITRSASQTDGLANRLRQTDRQTEKRAQKLTVHSKVIVDVVSRKV